MKLSFWTLILTLIFLTNALHGEELWLRVGEIRSVAAPEGKSVRVAGRGIVKVVDGPKAVQVIGLKPGTVNLAIGTQSYLVHVNLNQQKEFALELRKLIHAMMGLQLQSDTQKLTVTGTLLRWDDWLKLSELAQHYQGDYAFAAQALPDVAETALKYFSELARTRGFPVTRFRADPVFTALVPKASGLHDSVNEIFKPFGIRVEVSGETLMLEPLIRTKVVLAELSRDEAQELGVSWQNEYQAQVLPTLAGGQDGLTVTLKALEARGQAQILASPNLLCRSGGEAKFLAGGEFPIRIISRNMHDVMWKQYGVLLHVKPLADYHGAIRLEIETEVSMLDNTTVVEGIPGLKTNNVKSQFDLPGRRTIALSGLLRAEQGDSREGLPYLSRMPVLGNLFSSHKFQKRQSELVIFVTPEIYVPDSDEKIQMPKGWVRDEP